MEVTSSAAKRRVLGRSSTDEDPTETKQRVLDNDADIQIEDNTAQDVKSTAPEQTHHADANALQGSVAAVHDQSVNAQC